MDSITNQTTGPLAAPAAIKVYYVPSASEHLVEISDYFNS